MGISQIICPEIGAIPAVNPLSIFWSGAWGRCWHVRLLDLISAPWHQVAIMKQSKLIKITGNMYYAMNGA